MNRDTHEVLMRLAALGISADDAAALRRISMTLHRWHELECGDGNGCVEREEQTNFGAITMARVIGTIGQFQTAKPALAAGWPRS